MYQVVSPFSIVQVETLEEAVSKGAELWERTKRNLNVYIEDLTITERRLRCIVTFEDKTQDVVDQ